MTLSFKTLSRSLVALVIAVLAMMLPPPRADAGSYIVAQCSPGVYSGVDDAGFSASSTHYGAHVDCASSGPGLQVSHGLNSGETGTVQGAFGAWIWQAPAGTYITGGSTF